MLNGIKSFELNLDDHFFVIQIHLDNFLASKIG